MNYFFKQYVALIIAGLIVIFTLFYTENDAIEPFKSIARGIGLIDSEKTIRGIVDIRSADHVLGDVSSDIVILEFSDYECILCAAMRPVFERLVKEQDVAVVYRHLYRSRYSSGFLTAVYAECVGKHIGEVGFYAFTNDIYENQSSVDADYLLAAAIRTGIDPINLNQCVESDAEVKKKIEDESLEGWRLGARGTPFIVVIKDGTPLGVSYANRYEDFSKRVRDLVSQAN